MMEPTEPNRLDDAIAPFYLYERRQRQTSLVLLFNMGVLFAMYVAARTWLEPTEASDQLFFWMNIAVPVVELCLLLLAIYFWIRNGTFRISVDANRFAIDDPLSKTYSFSVPVSEIEEIRQTHQQQSNVNTIMMYLKSGEKIQLTQNYSYSRKSLYAALKKANPSIGLPEHRFRFKQVG